MSEYLRSILAPTATRVTPEVLATSLPKVILRISCVPIDDTRTSHIWYMVHTGEAQAELGIELP